MKYSKDNDKPNQQSLRDQKAHGKMRAGALLKPLDWKSEKPGIRRRDIGVFKAAAAAFNHIIVVRETNEPSLPYVGHKGFYSKPLDCKAKTADMDVSFYRIIGDRPH